MNEVFGRLAGGDVPSCCLNAHLQVLMDVYNHLSKVDEFLPLAKQERYMFTFRGKNMVFPVPS